MVRMLKFIMSGEFLFAVFLLSGVFKESLHWMPFDLTLIMLVLTLVISVKKKLENKIIYKRVLFMLIIFLSFLFLVVSSSIYTDSVKYFIDKTIRRSEEHTSELQSRG